MKTCGKMISLMRTQCKLDNPQMTFCLLGNKLAEANLTFFNRYNKSNLLGRRSSNSLSLVFQDGGVAVHEVCQTTQIFLIQQLDCNLGLSAK